MRVLWESKAVRIIGYITVVTVGVMLALMLVPTLLLPFTLLRFIPLLGAIPAFAIAIYAVSLEPFRVLLREDGLLEFHRLFRTTTILPSDLTRVSLAFGGVAIQSQHGRFLFRGRPSQYRVLERSVLEKADADATVGILSGGLPTDQAVWRLLIELKKLNPELEIRSPYILQQLTKVADQR